MVIQHNISALNAHRNMGLNNSGISKNLEKLSSGYKINRAGDDAAGLAISEKMRGQIRGLEMAEQNANNGISLIQTAEGGLNETHAILQRMRELSVQSSNGTYQNSDREQLTKEFEALKSEVDRISESTHYNGIKLLDGTMGEVATADITDAKLNLTGDMTVANANTTTQIEKFEVKDGKVSATIVHNGEKYTASAAISTTTDTLTFKGSGGSGSDVTLQMNFASVDKDKLVEFTYRGTEALDSAAAFGNADMVKTSASVSTGLVFQIGANGGADQRVALSVGNMDSKHIGIAAGKYLANASIDTIDNANDAIEIITAATDMVSGQRAELGALQNRLEHTLNNLGVTKENLTAAESSIRDVDMAKEMMQFTKNNILVQASQSMLAQANQLPQGVLQLLR